MSDTMTREQAFGELRSQMAKPPSPDHFNNVLLFLAKLPFDREYLEEVVVPYMLDCLKHWPPTISRPLYGSSEKDVLWGKIQAGEYSGAIFSLVDTIYLTPGNEDCYPQELFPNVTTLRAHGAKTAPALMEWDWSKVTHLYLDTHQYDNSLLKQVLAKGRDTLQHLTLSDDGTSRPFRLDWLKVVPNLKTLSLRIPMNTNGITSVLNKLPPKLEKLTLKQYISLSAWQTALRDPSTSLPESLEMLEVLNAHNNYLPWSRSAIREFERIIPKHIKIAYL